MDINTINKIVEEKLLNDIDIIIEYDEVGIYQGLEGCLEYIQKLTGCDRDTAQKIIDEHEELKPSNESIADYERRTTIANAQAKELLNKPKCITCGSTNVKPISDTERTMSVIGLGIFSKKINKTYKCLNCKCTW